MFLTDNCRVNQYLKCTISSLLIYLIFKEALRTLTTVEFKEMQNMIKQYGNFINPNSPGWKNEESESILKIEKCNISIN